MVCFLFVKAAKSFKTVLLLVLPLTVQRAFATVQRIVPSIHVFQQREISFQDTDFILE